MSIGGAPGKSWARRSTRKAFRLRKLFCVTNHPKKMETSRMKYLPPKSKTEAGSVLLVSLIITAVLGLTLASYLIMSQQQNVSVMRSQTWNSAIVMSEAGVEDALSLLNKFNS